MRVSHFSAAINNTTGTQNITGDLNGEVPKAVIIYSTFQTAQATQTGAAIIIGAFTASNGFTITARAQDGVLDTAVKRSAETNQLWLYDSAQWVPRAQISISSFIANGMTINITATVGTQAYISGVFFSGADLSVQSGIASLTGSATTTTVTTSFEMQSGIFLSPGREFLNRSVHNAQNSVGFYGGGNSRCFLWYNASRDPSTYVAAYTGNYVHGDISGASVTYLTTLSNIKTTSFDLTPNAAANDQVGYLVFNQSAVVTTIDTPTVTGTATYNISALPKCILTIPNTLQAVSTYATNYTAGAWGFAGTVGTSSESCATIADEDGQATTDNERTFATYVKLNQDSGASGFVAKFVSYNSTGWSWNFSATLGTATKWPVMVFTDDQAQTVAMTAGHIKITGYVPLVALGTGETAFALREILSIAGYVPTVVAGNAPNPAKRAITILGPKPTVSFIGRTSYVKIGRNSLNVRGYLPGVEAHGWRERQDSVGPLWLPLADREEEDKFF